MPQYILLATVSRDVRGQSSPEELQKMTSEYMNWVSSLVQQGKYSGGQKLKDEIRRLHRAGSGEIVIDGPYTESKELIAGFFQIEAASSDEAAEIAKGCPALKYGGTIELREIDPMTRPS
jgi:hypothetical protein